MSILGFSSKGGIRVGGTIKSINFKCHELLQKSLEDIKLHTNNYAVLDTENVLLNRDIDDLANRLLKIKEWYAKAIQKGDI